MRYNFPGVGKTNLKKGAEMRQLEKYVIGGADGPVIIAGIHLCGALAIKAVALFNRQRAKVSMLCLKPCCLPGRIHAAREEAWTLGTTTIDAVDLYAPIVANASNAAAMTREQIVAASRKKQHEDAHDKLEAEATVVVPAAAAAGGGKVSGGQKQNVRFQRWGELLLAGVGEAEELAEAQGQARQQALLGQQQQGEQSPGGNTNLLLRTELHNIDVQKHHFQNVFLFASRCCTADGCAADGGDGACKPSAGPVRPPWRQTERTG